MAGKANDIELVYLDSIKMGRILIERGWSMGKLKDKLDTMPELGRNLPDERVSVSRNTLDKAFKGQGVRRDTAKFIADHFECNVLELLDPRDPHYEPPTETVTGSDWEWAIDETVPWICRTAANGVHMFL